MTSNELKQVARELGADLVGIAPIERWKDLPANENPLSIMPECRSVIVIGRKILRGAFRGVEEGTNFGSTYGNFGKDWHELTVLGRIIFAIANKIEETGVEAMPMHGAHSDGQQGRINAHATCGEVKIGVQDGSNSSVVVNTKQMAHLAGLGSIGKGGFFLTRQYGLRQHFGIILTDGDFAGDDVIDVDFCNGCNACFDACPLAAYDKDGALNIKKCQVCKNGAMPANVMSTESLDRFASACGRACIVATEDKIEERFHSPFRKRAIWTRDIDGIPTVTPLDALKK